MATQKKTGWTRVYKPVSPADGLYLDDALGQRRGAIRAPLCYKPLPQASPQGPVFD